jgi:DNA-binding CsgD family transcriptional regulator
MLHGRAVEQKVIDRLLTDAREGRSGALVVRGEAGIGKSALLDHARGAATDMRVLRTVGVEAESELPFASLHLLLRTCLDRVTALPDAQAVALRGALGLNAAPPADRFLTGLAVLTLLSDLAEDGPLLVLADDTQWLDRSSADALVFAARRLDVEGIAMIFAVRDGSADFPLTADLPELQLGDLDGDAARSLLLQVAPDLAPSVRDRVLAETRGNPLALTVLPAALTAEQRAGETLPFAHHVGPLPLPSRVQATYQDRIGWLPLSTQELLLVAAADDTGDLNVVLTAAAELGASVGDAEAAERAALIQITDTSVTFGHPLVRSASYQSAPLSRRLAAHRALAAAFTGEHEQDRRAWHLAAATTGPDETAARDLERTAERARDRSGYAAVAAAYERAAHLSPDAAGAGRRLVAAAEAAADAGQLRRARALAGRAAKRATEPAALVRIARVRAAIEFEQGTPRAAHALLMNGTDHGDAEQVAEMMAEAVRDAWFAGDPDLGERAADRLRALALPPGSRLLPLVHGMCGLADLLAGDPETGLPALHELTGLARRTSSGGLGERLISGAMGLMIGDDTAMSDISGSLVADCRIHGLIGWLPHALQNLAVAQLCQGTYRDAIASVTESLQIAKDTEQNHRVDHSLGLLAWLWAVTGDEEQCRGYAEDCLAHATSRGIAPSAAWATWGLALLDMGAGRHRAALERLEASFHSDLRHPLLGTMYAPDQVEAAVRLGLPERAVEPLQRFERWALAARQPWADAVLARCRAMTADEADAETFYAEAVRSHHRGNRPFEAGRTRLLYGEWLRRVRRKSDARVHLRAALETFERIGTVPWAERAGTELRAAGEGVARHRPGGLTASLTPQELQVVRLAAHGASNRGIGAQLFLSPRTIAYHLYKAFPKLGVTGRAELARLDLEEEPQLPVGRS